MFIELSVLFHTHFVYFLMIVSLADLSASDTDVLITVTWVVERTKSEKGDCSLLCVT